jgi:ssDNA-binding Zn-finger/Zn-ribbon topoisomerase 1
MTDEKTYNCPTCGDELKRVWSKKKSRYYWVCQNASEACGKWYPDRDGKPAKPVKKGDPDPNVLCPECESPMVKITGAAHGDFWSCARHKETGCKGTIDILPDGSLPPLCPNDPEHGPMRFIRNSKNGPFLSCRRYSDPGIECKAKMELPKTKKSSVA